MPTRRSPTRRTLLALGCLLLLLEGGRPVHVLAGCLEEGQGAIAILNLETAWALGGQAFTDLDVPPAFLGSWLVIRAVLADFEGCLEGENRPDVEQTLVLDGLTVGDFGLWQNPDTRTGGQVIRFDGGRIRVFRDFSPDADYLNDATFSDGELMLSGPVQSFLVTTGVPLELELTVQMEQHTSTPENVGRQFLAGANCDFECQPQSLTAPMAESGYFAAVSGSMVMNVAVAVTPTTWSSLKRVVRSEQE